MVRMYARIVRLPGDACLTERPGVDWIVWCYDSTFRPVMVDDYRNLIP
jgi:hypothetical protein